jgi:acetamidase/formamidase
MAEDPIEYPAGYNATVVTDEGGIKYLNPDPSGLDWKVPLRPHIGTLAVLPNNTANYLDSEAAGGASSIPPSRFGGNVDDWRIGKGGTMYYKYVVVVFPLLLDLIKELTTGCFCTSVEVPGGMVLVGDTHAAQGDSELAGTAMETSMTAKLRITLHKAGSLPKQVQVMPFPLLETSSQYVIHGFAYDNYLDQLEDASAIFVEGASLDRAFEDCFLKTRYEEKFMLPWLLVCRGGIFLTLTISLTLSCQEHG